MGKTKAEEREALMKIREILEDFSPEDTYIGKAFEGCVEQAEENLGCDWMMSYKVRYDNVSEQLHAANVRIAELAKQLNQKDDAIARLEDANNQLSEEIGRLDGVIAQSDSDRQELLGNNLGKRMQTCSGSTCKYYPLPHPIPPCRQLLTKRKTLRQS